MSKMHSTIRELLVAAEQDFGAQDAFRYKVKSSDDGRKKEVKVESKTYTQLKNDTECFSAALAALGQQGKHIAIVGPTSYSWVVAYFGVADSGSVVVPLDANLPEADLCELIDRADVTTLVYDEAKAGVAEMAAKRCEKLEHIICMDEPHGVEKEHAM
ncbi:MAG: long-chain fatty acid--CoA ligase, partial [Lachnospiraceae bacterium]|nr:long-chain fatty acid--CoA ligase [Lachnospiraceae bacterium]